MVIEAEKDILSEVGKKLVTIDDARRFFRELPICPEDQIDEKIRYYREQYPEFSPNDTEAAAVAADMIISMNPSLRTRFIEKYGVYPAGSRVIKEKAFGGLEIDPQKANLPVK